ncbi:hypothetical protein [Amycolatopsis sp. cmx-8-4]|uniref:hypothetical protein n=1 Tax=Amycolatopsis sp. cmx-8-4 TaxID=2790947 RepID=UPI0039799FE2
MRKVLVFAVAGAALTIGGTTAALASSHPGTDDGVRPSTVSTTSGTPTHSGVSATATVPESSATSAPGVTSVPSTYPSAGRHGSRTAEPGDDRGRSTVEPGDDHGRGVEPGDDHGGRGAEPGDDHGGRGGEPGDDHGGHHEAAPAPATTADAAAPVTARTVAVRRMLGRVVMSCTPSGVRRVR